MGERATDLSSANKSDFLARHGEIPVAKSAGYLAAGGVSGKLTDRPSRPAGGAKDPAAASGKKKRPDANIRPLLSSDE
jgi:hypothetical protein